MILPSVHTSILHRLSSTHFSVDASQIDRGGRARIFGQVYEDAADQGLELISARTGHALKMVVQREHRNADNDITHWVLTSCPRDMNRLKMSAPLQLTVWNT